MSMFGSPATDATLEDRVAQLEAAIASLTGTVDGNAGSVAQAIDAVAQQRLAGDDAALAAVNDAVAGSVERSEQVDTRLGAEIVIRAQETDHLNQRVDGLLGEVDTRVGVAEFYAERAALSEANVAAMSTQPTNAAQLWETVGVVRGLSSLVGAFDGQRGEVFGLDMGSHVDPVTGLTVANAGVYQWVEEDGVWTWVSEAAPEILMASRATGQYQVGLVPWDSGAIEDAFGNRIGLSFAAGENGDNSGSDQDAVLKVTDYLGLSPIHQGARVRCHVQFLLSTVFRPTITPFLQLRRRGPDGELSLVNLTNASVPSTSQYTIVQNARVGNIQHVVLDFIAMGNEQQAAPFLRFSGANSLGGESIVYMDHRFSMVSRSDDTLAQAAQQLGAAVKGAALGGSDDGFARSLSPVPITISRLGAGETYSDFRTAYIETGAGELTARKAVAIKRGVYVHNAAVPGDTSYILPKYTNFAGNDAPFRCVVQHLQANDVAPELTSTNEPIRIWYYSVHEDYTMLAENVRYTNHADPGVTQPDQTIIFSGMRVRHRGNQGAYDYQASLGGAGNPGGVWSLARAHGYGASSGWTVSHDFEWMRSYKYVFGLHDNIDFVRSVKLTLDDDYNSATGPDDDNYAYRFGVLGSGKASKIRLRATPCNGDLQVVYGPWLSVKPDNQPADPSWQFQIRGQSHDAMKQVVSGAMRALRIMSASTADGPGINLSGSTPALIDAWFGDVYAKPGAGGMAAYVWGYNNISAATVGSPAIQLNSLGKRAGNRAGDPWLLSISDNGAAPVVVTFDSDLTLVANSTILATINAALGYAGASEFNVLERTRGVFAGEESPRRNSSATTIPWRAWTAADTSMRKVRLMTALDASERSAGSAFASNGPEETGDIYPGETGRVKHGGLWGSADLLINGAPMLARGDLLEIDPAQPGRLVKNNYSIRPVLRCVGPDLFARVS